MTIIELYKKLTDQDITADKLNTEQKAALETLVLYDEAIPEDMAKAIGELVKIPEPPEEDPAEGLEKAGAKLSKDTITKLKGVAKAILALLPEDERDVAKADPEEERENRIADKVVEKLGLAKASEDEKPDTKPDEKPDDKPKDDKGNDNAEDDTPDSEVAKQLKAFSDRLAVVEKAKGVKKGLDEDGSDDTPVEDEWPSMGLTG